MTRIQKPVPRHVPKRKRRRVLGHRELRRSARNAAERRKRARKWSLEATDPQDIRFLFAWSKQKRELVRADALKERRSIGWWIRDAIEKELRRKELT